MDDRRVWIITACVIIAGLFVYIVWPWLWLVRLGIFVVLAVIALYFLSGGVLKRYGQWIEVRKQRHFINPVEGRLPAWIHDGMVEPLEPPPLPSGLRLSLANRGHDTDRTIITEEPQLLLPPGMGLPPKAPPWYGAMRDFQPGFLVLGYGVNGPIKLPLSQTKSISVVGKPGTGKSNTLRSLIGQFRMMPGAIYRIWDPHGDLSAELGGLTEIADILDSALNIQEIYDLRQKLYKPPTNQRDFDPFVVVIDEYKEVHRSLKHAKPIISSLITGGRKYNMHIIISSQFFKAEMFDGGAGDLDSIWTRYLHWTDTRQAEYARVSDEEAKNLLEHLKDFGTTGFAILSNPAVETQIANISQTESSDLARIP